MINMFYSASRNVLLMLALTACVGFLLRILKDEYFMQLAILVFAFYYSKPVDKSSDEFVK